MTSTQREWRFGAIHLRLEPPDILWHKTTGFSTFEDCVALMALYQELGSQAPFFAVVDVSEATSMDEETRRYVSEHSRPEWFAGYIYVRARLLHKAMAKGIGLALRLAGRDAPEAYFVSTEEEARALIARLRRGP